MKRRSKCWDPHLAKKWDRKIEMFRNLRCMEGVPLSMFIQACQHNLLVELESYMGVVKAYPWKEFVNK